jgi:hypothetical protein
VGAQRIHSQPESFPQGDTRLASFLEKVGFFHAV